MDTFGIVLFAVVVMAVCYWIAYSIVKSRAPIDKIRLVKIIRMNDVYGLTFIICLIFACLMDLVMTAIVK
jgi:hypothetical protein